MANSVYDFTVKNINGEEVDLSVYSGKALLIVNTASKCGFTPQYKGLEDIYPQLKNLNVEILGFPCNQFGGQEPGSEEEIKEFCDINFKISFPMFAKIDVNGKNAHPLYQYLANKSPGLMGTKIIKWNFTKFLVDHKGQPIKRFAPKDTPLELLSVIQDTLSSPRDRSS